MSALSDYLAAHIPAGWSRADVVRAVGGTLDQATVYRYLGGQHTASPPERVLQAFADALPGTSIVELREAAGLAAGEEAPWTLPPEAQRLNRAQRSAIEQLIRVFLAAPDTAPGGNQVSTDSEPVTRAQVAQIREYAQHLRETGQGELADRLEASLVTNSASKTARRSSKS
jgi:hypothetical protein